MGVVSRPAIKIILTFDLENVGHVHHLQNKSRYLSYYMSECYQFFIEMIAMRPAIQISYQMTFKM